MRPVMIFVCLMVVLAGPLRAGSPAPPRHDANVDEVWSSIRSANDDREAQRAQIVRMLELPATRRIARSYGLDLDAARRNVRVLDDQELQALSQRAAMVEPALAGGDKIVVSSTLIIIVLLVIILLLVA